MRKGRLSLYSTVTWDLPSGRRYFSVSERRTSASLRASLCANWIGRGINSSVSLHANPNMSPWSPAPPVSTPKAMSVDCLSTAVRTAQVSQSKPNLARV